jgi:tetratricopeptide (TPR) repeat protein
MDSLITAAARALAVGDPLGALKRVALRDDPPALALRGIAMAQLGDFARARALLKKAARAFGAREAMARARCIVAEAEIALASRDLAWPSKTLEMAQAVLEEHDDHANAAHAHYLLLRRDLLIGRLDDVERGLAQMDPASLPLALKATHALIEAGIAIRRLRTRAARTALAKAARAARQAGIPALMAEVERAAIILAAPAARRVARSQERLLRLDEVEALMASGALVIDACRYVVRDAHSAISLASRPVLFALAYALAAAWPADVSRNTLIAQAFRTRHGDDSHRARLRVEMGRLRAMLRPLASVHATAQGFVLASRGTHEVVVLAPAVQEEHPAILAFLSDGESWSSSALALALGTSQRTVQRALDSLAAAGRIQSFGHGRARRWIMPPLPGFATTLLLPAPLPAD